MSEYLKDRENADAELVLEEYEFEVTGKSYSVKPIQFKYILKLEFSKDRLIIPQNEENTAEFQLYNIKGDRQRNKLNKWLKRLVTDTETEQAVDIETISADGWKLSDVGRLLLFILEISGLVPEKDGENAKEEKTDEEKKNEYVFLFALLQKNGTMSKSEILSHSLPYLYGISVEIQESEMRNMSMGGMGAFLGGVPTTDKKAATEYVSSCEEFEAFVNG